MGLSTKVKGKPIGLRHSLLRLFRIIPAALGPGVYSASNRNGVAEAEKLCFWGVERSQCIGLITSPPSVSRLSRQCGILNISQVCRPPRPLRGMIDLVYLHLGSLFEATHSFVRKSSDVSEQLTL
jgi:hypothetical protein